MISRSGTAGDIRIDHELRGHRRPVRASGEISDVAFQPGQRPGLDLQFAVDALGGAVELDEPVPLDGCSAGDCFLCLGDLLVDPVQGPPGPRRPIRGDSRPHVSHFTDCSGQDHGGRPGYAPGERGVQGAEFAHDAGGACVASDAEGLQAEAGCSLRVGLGRTGDGHGELGCKVPAIAGKGGAGAAMVSSRMATAASERPAAR
jgi:hypothetical protein